MKELKAIIRNYVSDKADIQAEPVFDWIVAEHPELWETYKEEHARRGLLSTIKSVFNEHARPLRVDYSGVQQEFRLQEEQKVIKEVPGLPRHIHIMDPDDGTATYYPWQEATDKMLAADEAFSIKQAEDCTQRAMAISRLRRLRKDLGIPPDVTFSQHWDALRQ